eukprot:SAG11_NODE_3010_length_2766_cov_13.698163_1_plen_40_part_00
MRSRDRYYYTLQYTIGALTALQLRKATEALMKRCKTIAR